MFKLNKNVGRNCFPDPSDVIIVQACLANIKVSNKPLWSGKIDGKNSRELATAIETFQTLEGLKVTGKVEAFGGPTITKMKAKANTSQVEKIISQPYIGNLPNDNIFKIKEQEIKRALQSLSSLPPDSVGPYIVKFWPLLGELGDPIAQTALDIHYRRGLGMSTVHRLKYFLGDNYIKTHPPKENEIEHIRLDVKETVIIPNDTWRRKQNEWIEEQIRLIQISVAIEHWNFVAKDIKNIKGKLSPDTITKYHHTVFDRFNLPPEAFGGTPFTTDPNDWINKFLANKVWCKDCDIVETLDE